VIVTPTVSVSITAATRSHALADACRIVDLRYLTRWRGRALLEWRSRHEGVAGGADAIASQEREPS
jgi:hypothetical protein